MRLLALVTLATSTAYMLFSAADMTESWAGSELWMAMSRTEFGHLWCVRLIVLLLVALLVGRLSGSRAKRCVLFGFLCLVPLFSSLTGHAATAESAIALHVGIDWVHSAAVAIWSGGLLNLSLWLAAWTALEERARVSGSSYRVVKRFSYLAVTSTGLIGATGVAMAYLAGVSFSHPWQSRYGLLVLAKTVIFAAALGAASVNHFLHLRGFDLAREVPFARDVRREALIEFALVFIIFGFAGFLTRTPFPMMSGME